MCIIKYYNIENTYYIQYFCRIYPISVTEPYFIVPHYAVCDRNEKFPVTPTVTVITVKACLKNI